MNRTPPRGRRAARLLMAAGLLALVYAAYVMVDAAVFQAVEHRRLEQARRAEAPDSAAVTAATAVAGEPIGEIQIERIALSAVVVEGDSAPILRRAVGHLAGTALPGEAGNVVLAGHRDTFFRPLRRVQVGDAITLTTPGGVFEYVVESTAVVRATDVTVIRPTEQRTLTLVTCYPFGWLGPAPDRFIVRAKEAAATGPAR